MGFILDVSASVCEAGLMGVAFTAETARRSKDRRADDGNILEVDEGKM
jgi:hypothetical protein